MSDPEVIVPELIEAPTVDAGTVRTGNKFRKWEARRVELHMGCPGRCGHATVRLQAGMPFNNYGGYRGTGFRCSKRKCDGLAIVRVQEV